MNIFDDKFDRYDDYIVVKYYIKSKTTLRDAAWNLAIGQSVGNPNVRNEWETEELFQNHSCIVLHDEKELLAKTEGQVNIAFPSINTDFTTDGVSHFLCQIMGGQLDIDIILKCQVQDVDFPDGVKKYFKGPKFGIDGIRKYTKIFDKPLVGGIIKPKTGVSPEVLLEMTKQLVEGGVNFIKEDEILSNPSFCPLEKRVELISEYLKDKDVVYAYCINADPAHVIDRVKMVHRLGGNAVHINFWSGMGVYKSIRDLDLPLFLHFQKSGDKILTNSNHDFHINWRVICKLATMMGADFIHAGMWGGYMNNNEEELTEVLQILRTGNTMPALSCGMHPGLVQATTKRFGNDFLANAGGAIHGHSKGTKAGVRAMVQAVNDETNEPEYQEAINKWGLVV